jgi:lipopolysaccharide transport system ATP-binding protein
LNKGNIIKIGHTDAVLKTYIETGINAQFTCELPPPKDRHTPGYAHQLTVEDESGNPVFSIPVGKKWQVRINFTITRNIDHFVIGLGILTSEELPLQTSWSKPYSLPPGEYQAIFRQDTIILGTGRYTLAVGLSQFHQAIYYVENAGILDIAAFSEDLDLIRVSSVGSILNPMNVELIDSNNLLVSLVA